MPQFPENVTVETNGPAKTPPGQSIAWKLDAPVCTRSLQTELEKPSSSTTLSSSPKTAGYGKFAVPVAAQSIPMLKISSLLSNVSGTPVLMLCTGALITVISVTVSVTTESARAVDAATDAAANARHKT